MFLDIVDKDDGHAPIVILGAPRPPHHLKNVCDWIINVATQLSIKILCSLDDDQVGGEVDAPRQSAGRYQNLVEKKEKGCILVTIEMTFVLTCIF